MSLRSRLTAAYTLFFALTLVVLGIALYTAVRQLLRNNVEEELRVSSALIQNAYASGGVALGDPSVLNVVSSRPQVLVRVFDTNRDIVLASARLRNEDLAIADQQITTLLAGRSTSFAQQTLGDAPVLTLLTPLQIGQRTVGIVQVAESLQPMHQALRALTWALAGGGVLALVAATGGGFWLTRAALRPIDDVSTTAERILGADDLGQRVPPVVTHDELGRLTSTINAMLARMERTFRAQQRFTADVAHELRTPLAAMRGNLEILRRGGQHNAALLDESLHDIESEVLRLTRMANDLLVLAQADAGVALRRSSLALDEVVLEVYRELRALAGDTDLRVDLHDQVTVEGDRDRIKQALINLVANALQHTPPHGRVTLALHQTATHAVVMVTDTGSGISLTEQPFIFNRFYRGDAARSGGGSGLGLAIVQWVAEAHDGQVHVQSEPNNGTTFTFELPRTPVVIAHQRDTMAAAR